METINLIKKDILVCKKYFAFSLLYVIIFSTIFQEMGMVFFTVSAVAVNYLITNTSMAFDDKYNSDIMINILPVSRKDIIRAKYLNSFVIIVFTFIIYHLLAFIAPLISIFHVTLPIADTTTVLMSLLTICIFNSVEIPLYMKFGYQKTRYFGFFIFCGFFGLSSIIVDMNIREKLSNFMINSNEYIKYLLIILVTILISYISYVISLNIYKRKDF